MCSFIFGCSGPLGCMGFLKLQRAGATPSCGAPASLCGDLPYCGAWAPGHAGFSRRSTWLNSCSSRALEHRLSSCGAGARLFEACLTSWTRGQTRVSCIGGGLFTPEPPGKPCHSFKSIFLCVLQKFHSIIHILFKCISFYACVLHAC